MRKHQRFVVESPVTVGLKGTDNGEAWKFGVLCDIGARGARIRLDKPLPVGTPIGVLVHFTLAFQQKVTLRCDGIVTRTSEDRSGEIGVRFQNRSRFLKGGLMDLLRRYQMPEGELVFPPAPASHQHRDRTERGHLEEDVLVKKH